MDIDAVNRALYEATEGDFLSPYYALEQVRDVLAERNVYLPSLVFCEGDGIHLFNLGEDRYLAFKYERDEDKGIYEAFAQVQQTQAPVDDPLQKPPLRNPKRNNRNLTVGPPDDKVGTDFAKQ